MTMFLLQTLLFTVYNLLTYSFRLFVKKINATYSYKKRLRCEIKDFKNDYYGFLEVIFIATLK